MRALDLALAFLAAKRLSGSPVFIDKNKVAALNLEEGTTSTLLPLANRDDVVTPEGLTRRSIPQSAPARQEGAADAQRFSVSPADTGSSAATVDAKDATLGKRKVADAVLSVRLRSEEPLLTSDYETSAKETVRLDDIVPPDILPQSAPSRQGGAADAQGDGICFHDAHCGISD